MNHVRFWGEVTESPVGTVSFYRAGKETRLRDIAVPLPRNPTQLCPSYPTKTLEYFRHARSWETTASFSLRTLLSAQNPD